ncbi:MAG: 4Fe-4S ferredoxin [Deltaproteobacteria bacterium HGW-Deltaproteobacteria-13]|jgi:molybdopterin-containing oxidoreductase family iron-sulfur binding subunit|nr:MAG: 4Fe-4S ferredoxin [Deltaproteobacteria bacterium HGW-Deltaproteobacteria-13]
MTSNRRDFLKIAGASALTLMTPAVFRPVWAQDITRIPGQSITPAKALTAKRWAMAVDPLKCRDGCVDCIAACHATHNVPDFGNRKDEIKWIWTEPFAAAFSGENHAYYGQSIQNMQLPVLCNHCANPPCVRVCPTKATFKRPDGIVMMDYHRCIGCRLCMAACPYGARSMNYRDPRPFIAKINPDFPTRTKGVVEKCNFCEERLAKGLLPACVLACEQKALVFGDVENPASEIRLALGKRFNLRRRAHLGTAPQVYYIL